MPDKIEALNPSAQNMVQVVYQIFYDAAIETETNEATCKNAEKAVEGLVSSVLHPGYRVTWVGNLEHGEALYEERMKRFLGSHGLTDSMYEGLSRDFKTAASDHIKEAVRTVFTDLVHERVSNNCDFDVHKSLNIELSKDLLPLIDGKRYGANTVLSLPRDLPWIAECSFWARTWEQGCGVNPALWISALTLFFETAYALWVTPGEVLICKKPSQVTTDSEGRIINTLWDPGIYVNANASYEDPRPGDVTTYNQ